MPRNTIFLILAILISMLLFWNFSSGPNTEATPETIAITPEEELPAVPTRMTPSPLRQAARAQKQLELAELQQRLNAENEKRAAQAQTLAELKKRQQQIPGAVAAYRSQINRYDTEIQNLLDILSNYRDAEEDLNRSASEALQNQDSAARLARDQLDMQIQVLERNMQNTQRELNYLRDFAFGIDINQLKMQTDRLQAELAVQQSQLNTLRAERVEISARILEGTGTIRSLAEQARSELRDSAETTQEQIFSLRTEIDRLQGGQYQTQSAASTLRSQLSTQISQVEKDLKRQDQEVKSLQQQVLNKQSELGTE